MIKAFRGPHMKFELHLEEKQKKQALNDMDKQILHLSGDIENLRTKVRQIEKAVAMMDEEAFGWMHVVEEKSNLSYVIKRKGLKHESWELKNDIVTSEKEIKVPEDKKNVNFRNDIPYMLSKL